MDNKRIGAFHRKKKVQQGPRLQTFRKNFRRDWQLHLLMLLPVIYALIFYYWPMYGVQIAFRDFSPRLGITGSEWVGLKWFEKFITNYNFKRVFANTVLLSFGNIAFGFPLPIIFALMLNTMKDGKFKKFTQNITYIPHFISIVVLVTMVRQVFNPINGLYGALFHLFGGEGYPYDFQGMAENFRPLYIGSAIWKNLGWNTIIYTAALGSVSPELHEAATVDGASRWQRVLHVDLPAIMPTVCIMLILRCGQVMAIGFEHAYLMQTTLNLQTAEIIPTYVYKVGMGSSGDFSFATAIGLFNSVINCALLIFVNWVSKTLSNKEVSLF